MVGFDGTIVNTAKRSLIVIQFQWGLETIELVSRKGQVLSKSFMKCTMRMLTNSILYAIIKFATHDT